MVSLALHTSYICFTPYIFPPEYTPLTTTTIVIIATAIICFLVTVYGALATVYICRRYMKKHFCGLNPASSMQLKDNVAYDVSKQSQEFQLKDNVAYAVPKLN